MYCLYNKKNNAVPIFLRTKTPGQKQFFFFLVIKLNKQAATTKIKDFILWLAATQNEPIAIFLYIKSREVG